MKTTTKLSQIKSWAEERRAKPARVKRSVRKGSGLLRIVFPNRNEDELLEEIPWDVWYEIFRASKLRFLYEDRNSDEKESDFFKLIEK